MSELTPNLKLFKYNTETDAKQPFSINDCMNANWDKIDASLRINDKLTNCLLEVPQRIKYTLVDGTITIKAGSVLIVPYGVEDLTAQYPLGSVFINDNFKVVDTQFKDGKFFVRAEIQEDISRQVSGSEIIKCFVQVSLTRNAYWIPSIDSSTSGSTDGTIRGGCYYNTSTNLLKNYDNPSDVTALPCMIIQGDGTYYTGKVNQVFNGFGYIGSTIWADKGIKGLIPNGRNEDGSLKNVEFATQNILLRNNTFGNNSFYLVIVDGGTRVSIADKQNWVFDEKSNRILENGVIRDNIGFYGDTTLATGGIVTSFNPKLPFRAVDYNDKSEISGWGMPSSRYIDLTLGASGSTYTAPANGYFIIRKYATGTAQAFYFHNKTSGISTYTGSPSTGWEICLSINAKKGDIVEIYDSLGGVTEYFRFIYAEGSK